jgi:micrococcal nuclease
VGRLTHPYGGFLGPPRWRAAVGAALVAVVCATGCGSAGGGGAKRSATLEKVTDGDTIRLVGLGRVRLIGVDTPEVYGQQECFGKEASAFVERLLRPGDEVTYKVGVEPRDRYGRLLAYVWLKDGRFLNLLLAEKGYALPLTIPPNVDFADRFVAAARHARERGLGLWSACDDSQPAR